jgi:hypothetical protein
MNPDELRAIMAYLCEKVGLASTEAAEPIEISWQNPTEEEMISAGLNADGVRRILNAPWWQEMVTDIIETPDFCEPEDTPQQVLEYARDVVGDYLRKRVDLKEE